MATFAQTWVMGDRTAGWMRCPWPWASSSGISKHYRGDTRLPSSQFSLELVGSAGWQLASHLLPSRMDTSLTGLLASSRLFFAGLPSFLGFPLELLRCCFRFDFSRCAPPMTWVGRQTLNFGNPLCDHVQDLLGSARICHSGSAPFWELTPQMPLHVARGVPIFHV